MVRVGAGPRPGTFGPTSVLAQARRVPLHERVAMLGVPIVLPSGGEARRAHVVKVREGFEALLSRVAALPDTQAAHSLLRQCTGPAKVLFFLRTLPWRAIQAFASACTVAKRAAGRA